MNKKEIENQYKTKLLIFRHQKELIVFWGIFLGVLLGFLLLIYFNLATDFTYQKQFIENTSGMITQQTNDFLLILTNNLKVAFYTFIISFLVLSALIFVIIWNASILAYFLSNLDSFKIISIKLISILPHAFLEIGGYVFAGIAGSILAYRVDRKNKFNHNLNKEFFKDISILIISAVVMILVGAILEGL
jgi:uncharacterized membrane protein SpoIIM required for sporulation